MKNVKGYTKLPEQLKNLLHETHKAHLSMMGSEMRKKHTVEHIKEVKWDSEEKCLKVYFDHGEWYHYSPAGEWY